MKLDGGRLSTLDFQVKPDDDKIFDGIEQDACIDQPRGIVYVRASVWPYLLEELKALPPVQ